MASHFIRLIAICCALGLLSSCKDDPVLVRKHEEQRIEIDRLEIEIASLEAKLKNIPPDRSKELAESKAESEAQKAEIQKLETLAADLEARKKELEAKLGEQRLKFPAK